MLFLLYERLSGGEDLCWMNEWMNEFRPSKVLVNDNEQRDLKELDNASKVVKEGRSVMNDLNTDWMYYWLLTSLN